MYRKTFVAGTVLALFAAVSLAQSFDVVVVGSGGAGLSAAIMAVGTVVFLAATDSEAASIARQAALLFGALAT